ncbi:MAG: bifunctional serine/threonine-protein kinase/formylglycine-generating enzyme family protein [Planctomycetes bacterium]|nr:bifunctional serine/threonine-protein kinase/formylglycine-generating enzyme family protein [Planctomycetota bacterium]
MTTRPRPRVLALVGAAEPASPPSPPVTEPVPSPPAANLPIALAPGGRRGALSGVEWDGFTLGDLIGSGGMGEVYRALQHGTGRLVAFKVLPPAQERDPLRLARFANEARAAALVRHPQVVAVHAAGEHDARPWIAMELVTGGTLAERIAARRAGGEGPFPPLAALDLARQAAQGLAAIHAARLVHRDLKPGNLLLDPARGLLVADFGLARFVDERSLTVTGSVLGTPHYLSPEQGRGQSGDARSDLYGLGCVLYELLTLRPPFDATSAEALVFQHNFAEPELPAQLNPDVPADLQAVCLTCLQKDPERRFADATALADDLQRLADGLAPRSAVFAPGEIGTGAEEALRRLAGWRRRWWPLAVGATALALALAAGWWWWDARKDEQAHLRARLAPLARSEPAPATAAADLARLARLAGVDDPQVRQGRERLDELARLQHTLDALTGNGEARAEAAACAAQLALLTGGGDPRLASWRARLDALAREEAALRAELGSLDRASPLTAPLRAAATPRLTRLAVLAGADDPELVRWRALDARATADEEALRRTCSRLDAAAPLTAAALDELAAAHAALAAFQPADGLPASWALRLEQERRRLAGLRARLAAGLAAAVDDLPAAAAAAAAAQALDALLALEPADRKRLDERSQERELRRAALVERLSVLDRAHPTPTGIEADLARFEALAGVADPAAQRWRKRLAEIAPLRLRLMRVLAARESVDPEQLERDLDALAALVGPDDLLVSQGRLMAALRRRLTASFDLSAPPPADGGAELARFATLVGDGDRDVQRWRAKVARWQRAENLLPPLAALTVIGAEELAAAHLALAAVAADAPDAPTVADWTRRVRALAGPPAPPWAAGRGHDRHGPWLDLRIGTVAQRLRWLAPGRTTVGSPPDEPGRDGDETQVAVVFTSGRWIADRECSRALWRAVVGAGEADGLPVAGISASDAEGFCFRLGELLPGCRARLPGEAEWECAARAGAAGPWAGLDPAQAAEQVVHGAGRVAAGATRPPNLLGLYDCLGNLWEWTGDGEGHRTAGSDLVDPLPVPGGRRVIRGGGWADQLPACRIANRAVVDADARSPLLGFRFVVDP